MTVGLAASRRIVMPNGNNKRAATPEDLQRQIDIAMLRDSIDRLKKSPFASTKKGKRIMQVLRDYEARGKIAYAKPEDLGERGAWTGDEILVSDEYRGNLGKTIPTLVHEAAHAIWRTDHPITRQRPESPDEGGENEYHSIVSEVEVYRWLKEDLKLAQPDFEMDVRLERHNNGTLKAITIQNYKDRLKESQDKANLLLNETARP